MLLFFFFKQKTAYEMRISDWSSDVCSSDLPARLEIENRFGIEFADRAAVRALHVVGEDFEFGLGVGGRAAVEQHRLHVLLAVGLLCLARDRDLAQVSAGGGAAENRAHPLPRGRAGLGMGYGGDDFRSEEHTSDLQSLMRISYAVFCLKQTIT